MSAYCILNTNFESEEDREFLNIGRTASPLDEIFGMIADLASLQRDLRIAFSLLGSEKEFALQVLLQRCSKLEKLQDGWYSHNNQNFSPGANRSGLEDNPLMFMNLAFDPHEFDNLSVAKTYCLFWIASIVVKRVVYQVQKQLMGTSDPTHVLSSAREICQTVTFCMKPNTQMSGGHLALFAISQASKGYIDCGYVEMFHWCQYIYSILQSRGIGLAGRVSQEDWALWHLVQTRIEF